MWGSVSGLTTGFLVSPAGPQFPVFNVEATMPSHSTIYSVLFRTSLPCAVEDHIVTDLNIAI